MKKTVNITYTDEEFRELIRQEVKAVLDEQVDPGTATGDQGFINMDQAAEYLQISKSTLYKYVSGSKIPFIKQGKKRLLFKKSELENWLLQNRNLDMNGTAPDGWNAKLQQHVGYEQPAKSWTDQHWK